MNGKKHKGSMELQVANHQPQGYGCGTNSQHRPRQYCIDRPDPAPKKNSGLPLKVPREPSLFARITPRHHGRLMDLDGVGGLRCSSEGA